MKRWSLILLIALIALLICALGSGTALAITVDASSAILMDASTGRILFEQDPHAKLAPASTTKILTSLLVLENVEDLSATVTLPADFQNVGESSIYLEPGETVTYESLLYALMLRSANDAAQALAIGVAGSEEAFVEMMNAKSEELGLADSHWANVHGLDSEGHYTSAYDLAIMARAACQIPFFNTLVATLSYTLPWADYQYDRTIYNHNQFLDVYEGADGIKTGYTDKAGSCLVASATRDELRLIGVVMNAEDHYAAMSTLMDYGFSAYTAQVIGHKGDSVGTVKITGGRLSSVDVILSGDLSVAVASGADFTPAVRYDYPATLPAPVLADQPIGTASFTDQEGQTVTVDLYLAQSVERYTFGIVFRQVWQRFFSALL